jgi:trimeric autotransporter adhesin
MKMPKIKKPKMPSIPKIPAPSIPNPIDEAKKLADAAADATAKAAAATKKAADDAAAATAKAAAQTAKAATDTVNTINKITISAADQVKVTATKSAMATAKVSAAAMNDIEAGSKLALQGMEQAGSYAVEAGELIAEWAEANYCQIGVSLALGTIFAALLYRPEPTSVATTTAATAPLSSTAILYLAAKETVGAVAMGTACDLTAGAFVELIWISGDVRKAVGNKNKQILTDAIAFTLAKSIDAAAGAMIVPQSCAAVVAGIVTTLVAQLACEQTLPSGAREWATTGASGL